MNLLPKLHLYPKNEKNKKVRQRLLKIRAKKVIVATGSLERPLVFNNNDRPGIMLSSAVKKYADYYGVATGQKNIFFTNNDTAYESAISLQKKGIKVEAIIDIREQSNTAFTKEAEDLGIKIYRSYTVVNTEGYKKINKITIMELSRDGQSFASPEKIELGCGLWYTSDAADDPLCVDLGGCRIIKKKKKKTRKKNKKKTTNNNNKNIYP